MLDRGRKNDTEVLGGYDKAKSVGQVGGYEVAEDVRLRDEVSGSVESRGVVDDGTV